jgi:flagellar M-ring protein FliF
MRFAGMEEPLVRETAGVLGISLERTDLLRLAQTALFGIVGVLALLFVLRPMVLRLTTSQQGALANEAGSAAPKTRELTGEGARPALLSGGVAPAIGESSYAGLLEDESMVNLANIEGQIRASSIRRIAELVNKHPEASLSIMRGWIMQGAE